jgi:hypothetical protein
MTERRPKAGKWVDTSKAFVIHPDMEEALMNYDPNGNSIQKCFDERKKKIEAGEEYHNSDHDTEMKITARERSQYPTWEFPKKGRR